MHALLELAHAYLALADPSRSLAVVDHENEILRHRPELGTLTAAAHQLQAQIDLITTPTPNAMSSLTTAELRLLPLLPTHLSLPQIAARLHRSPHTVKAQVTSIYRKLGVSSRAEAVDITSPTP